MRELTLSEIEQLDFTGQVPDLVVPSSGPKQMSEALASKASASNTQVKLNLRQRVRRPKKRRALQFA